MNLEKPKRITNRAYLRWIKTQTCAVHRLPSKHVCEGPMDAHHATPVSLGGSDYTAIPLCRQAHTHLQSSVNARPWMLDIAEELHAQYQREHPLQRAPRQRAGKKAYVKKYLLRGWGVMIDKELQFPIVETIEEARALRIALKQGQIERCQVKIEGRK